MTEAEFKQYVRIKSCESGFKNVDITDPKTLQFRKGSEFTTYNFSWICTQNQVKTYELLAKKSVEKLIEGFSSTMIAYGAPNSGKTYTLIGKEELLNRTSDFFNGQDGENMADMLNDPGSIARSTERGIMLRAIEYIFSKAKSYDHIKHFIVSVSCLELARDRIIDLGRRFFKLQDSENRMGSQNPSYSNVVIEEDTNGNYDMPGLTVTAIKSIGNFYRFMKEILREPLRPDSHFMLEINLLQSDKENTDLENTESSLTFLELAYLGPDKEKQEDSLLLQSELNSLIQVLRNVREIESFKQLFRQSRLTKILKNPILRSNNICLIGTLQLKTDSINESFSTLNFLTRTKEAEAQEHQESPHSTVLELRAKYQKLSRSYESLVEEHREKMQQLQDYIGLEVNLNELHRHTHNSHEINQINTFKQAVERVKWLTGEKLQNERKVQSLEGTLAKEVKVQEERELEYQQRRADVEVRVLKLKEEIRALQEEEARMYRDYMAKYEREVEEVNTLTHQTILRCSRDIEKVSNVTTLLNNLMEGRSIYEQAEMSAQRETKENLRKKLQQLSQQRQQTLFSLRQKYQSEKRALSLRLSESQKTTPFEHQQNSELNREITSVFHAIEQQERAVKQLLTEKYQSNYRALAMIKSRKHRLNINKQLYECLSEKGGEADQRVYKGAIISRLKEEIFAARLRIRG